MSMARVLIMAVVVEGRSKSEVARDYGVSRQWVQRLVARYEHEGEAAFEPHSRRPHTNPRRIAGEVEDAVLALRKQLSEAGHDAGAETIAWHLQQQSGHAPSVATIWRVHHPAATQAAPLVLASFRRRTAQRALASRHHPLAPGRRPRDRDPRHHR